MAFWHKGLLTALLGFGVTAVHAQNLNYLVSGASNTTSTYTDLGAAGTAITTPNTDDANSEAQPIGFSFNYNGQSFTNFVLNTNGYLKLGAAAPAAPYFYDGPQVTTGGPINNATETNLLLPFNLDLESASAATAEYRVATSGTAPNRICTIQWKNVSDKASGTIGKQFATLNFQVRLYETTNRIEFVYGAATAGPDADAFKSAAVGIKGSGTSSTQLISATKGSTGAWNTTTFLAGLYTGNAHNVRRTALPDAGRTYRFLTAAANDAAVRVYTAGQSPISSPQPIQALVVNNSYQALSNVPVTLTVTGTNNLTATQTVTSIPVGGASLVTFPAYSYYAVGTNRLTVTIPNDDVNTNNSSVTSQRITVNELSNIDPTQNYNPTGVGVGSADGILAAKHIVAQPTTIYEVQLTFAGSAGNTATYQVVLLDATGANGTPNATLYTSPTQTRTPDGGSVSVAIPNIAVAGDFYIGIKETSATNPALAYQVEDPLRPNTYFFKTATGAWTSINNTTLRTKLAIKLSLGTAPICLPPAAATVTGATSTSVTVTTTGPSNNSGYTIVYGPRGFNPTTAGTSVTAPSVPYVLTGLTASTTYDLYIRANCSATDQSALSGPVAFTTLCTPPVISAFPFAESFGTVAAGLTLPCGITVADINGDNNTWRTPTAATGNVTLANAMLYSYNSTDPTKVADDWFFTPALSLRAGSRYQLSFKYKTDASQFATSEKLEVKYGSAMTPAGQTNLLWRNESITNTTLVTTTGGTGANQVLPITPAADGTVYIGFHAFSSADQFNLYVDDISINSVVTGLSDALVKAVNVYPNPSAGMFTVEVRGANAKGAMKVEVTNLLGQRVHTATIRDNSENRIDLSTLANGMYTLKVLSGNDYMIRNIVVQK
jgi:hypothetical protein